MSPVHKSVAVRSSPVREEEGHLMCRHGHQRDEIPECVGILEVSLRVPLLGVDETGEEDGIPAIVVIVTFYLKDNS